MQKHILFTGFVVMLAGCASSHQRTQPLTSQLQLRIGELERQVQVKDEEIRKLNYDVKDLAYEVDRLKSKGHSAAPVSRSSAAGNSGMSVKSAEDDEKIIRVDASAEQVQRALKNAGYYNGAIDSKIGSGTRQAITKFQKDHGLNSDGIIGQKTWNELKSYLQ